ncbi:unnamed protein product [marine sediment metagenome]|uniref:Uncharacterized protein n=1 Tax=marine sediment metagenome TaxID=412755 RepID=X0YNU8_9ZZZZ
MGKEAGKTGTKSILKVNLYDLVRLEVIQGLKKVDYSEYEIN